MNRRTNLVLVSFLEDKQEGYCFVRSRHHGWPLHITLFPWFGVNDFERLNHKLAIIAQKTKPFAVTVGNNELFGKNLDIPVSVVQDQVQLRNIHEDLRRVILPGGELLDDTWTGDTYTAHITKHDDTTHPAKGSKIRLNNLYLVKLLEEDSCLVFKKYIFGANNENPA